MKTQRFVQKGDVVIITLQYGDRNFVDGMFSTETLDIHRVCDILDTSYPNGKWAWNIVPTDLHFVSHKDWAREDYQAFKDWLRGSQFHKEIFLRVKSTDGHWELRSEIVKPKTRKARK